MLPLLFLTINPKIEPIAEFAPTYNKFAFSNTSLYARTADGIDHFDKNGDILNKNLLPFGDLYTGKNICFTTNWNGTLTEANYFYERNAVKRQIFYRYQVVSYQDPCVLGLRKGTALFAENAHTQFPNNKLPEGYSGEFFLIGKNIAYNEIENQKWTTHGIDFQPIHNFRIANVSPNNAFIIGNSNELLVPQFQANTPTQPVLITRQDTFKLPTDGKSGVATLVDDQGYVFGWLTNINEPPYTVMWKNLTLILLDDILKLPPGYRAAEVLARNSDGRTIVSAVQDKTNAKMKTFLFNIP